MRKLRNFLLAAAGLAIVALAMSSAGAGPAVAQLVEATLVRAADNPARQPFQAQTAGRIFGTGFFSSVIAGVPAGKRLAIEYVSASMADLGFSEFILEVDAVQNGASVRHLVPIAQQTQAGRLVNHIAGQPVRIYADPGTNVTVAVTRVGFTSAAADVDVAVSGHLVDLQ